MRHGSGVVVVVRVFGLDVALAQTDLEYGIVEIKLDIRIACISFRCLYIKFLEQPFIVHVNILEEDECIVQRRCIVAP